MRSEIKLLPKVDEKQVTALIEQLNDKRFIVRDKAFKQLQQLGSRIEAKLRAALKNRPPLEMHNRTTRLLDQIEKGQSQNPTLRRELRAIHVLARIGNSSAIDYLLELAAGPEGAFRTRQARLALQHLGEL